ncbi:MAG: hypothetical protein AB8I08_13940 [Sandaracinaceae bacterium]
MTPLRSFGLVVSLLVSSQSLVAHAQSASELDPPSGGASDGDTGRFVEADPALVLRMNGLLRERASGESGGNVVNGILGLASGATLLAGSIWMAADDEAFGGFGGASPAMITGFAISPVMFVWGVYSLLGLGANNDRLLRWTSARAGGLSAVELARFEGELRAEANAARVSRTATLVLGVGVAAGGAITAILGGALEDVDDELRWSTVGAGAGLAAIGGLMIGLSFLESGVEQLWSRYRAGGEPTSTESTVELVISPTGVGVAGTF